jgi:3-hydroxymyristoyl/3-hydroxydecanoyl-(acyl carrier protein) dehydratase
MNSAQQRIEHGGPVQPDVVSVRLGLGLAELKLVIPPASWFFQGHFPDYPILPGAIQIHWVVQFAKRYFIEKPFPSAIRVKFRKPIRPNHQLTLLLERAKSRDSIRFEYFDANGPCSSGQIVFAPP